jgi:LmbE family N-acetylglucosaminyl deacetylase
MRDLVVLSPHLDDAVLSCGGRLARTIAAGAKATVVTLFTADEPGEPPSELARELRRWWKLPEGVMRARRAEDLDACAALGATPEHWDLPEAPYRLDRAGRPLYSTLTALFDEVADDDAPWLDRLAKRFEDRAEALGDALVLAPLGVGHHVDHQLVRAAAERAGIVDAYYEEFPYTEWKWLALRRALRAPGRPRAWREDVELLDADDIEARVRAIACYRSQVPAMFRTEGRLRKQVRRAVRRAGGGERIWRSIDAGASSGAVAR